MRILLHTPPLPGGMQHPDPAAIGIPVTGHQRAAVAEGFCPDCLKPLTGDVRRFCETCRTPWALLRS